MGTQLRSPKISTPGVPPFDESFGADSSTLTPTVSVSYLNPSTGASSTNTVGNIVQVNVSWTQTVKVPFGNTQSVSVGTQGYQVISR